MTNVASGTGDHMAHRYTNAVVMASTDTPNAAAKGHCAQCNALNFYANTICSECGTRLPWADAISAKKEVPLTTSNTIGVILLSSIIGVIAFALFMLVALWAAGLLHLPQANLPTSK